MDDNWLLLIPHAFVRGVTVAWKRGNLWRCLVVYSLPFIALLAGAALYTLFERYRIGGGQFWSFLALQTIFAVPISVYTAVVYFDAAGIGTTALVADDTVQ